MTTYHIKATGDASGDVEILLTVDQDINMSQAAHILGTLFLGNTCWWNIQITTI